MALKRYSCQMVPNLRIGSRIKFSNGFFETDLSSLQRLIEQNDLWGARIFEIPAPEGVSLIAPKNKEMEAAVTEVMAQKADPFFEEDILDIVDDNVDDVEEQPEEQREEESADLKEGNWISSLTATEITRMRVADIQELAAELGIEDDTPDKAGSTTRLRRAIRLKLGV